MGAGNTTPSEELVVAVGVFRILFWAGMDSTALLSSVPLSFTSAAVVTWPGELWTGRQFSGEGGGGVLAEIPNCILGASFGADGRTAISKPNFAVS